MPVCVCLDAQIAEDMKAMKEEYLDAISEIDCNYKHIESEIRVCGMQHVSCCGAWFSLLQGCHVTAVVKKVISVQGNAAE